MQRISIYISRLLVTLTALCGLFSACAASAQDSVSGIYTFRYVCFRAEPVKVEGDESKKRPQVFEDLQGGSPTSISGTPEAFLNELRKQDPNYKFYHLLSGKATLKEGVPLEIKAGPKGGDWRKTTLTDKVWIKRTAADTISLHQTGKFAYVAFQNSDGSLQETKGWEETVRENTIVGRTYSMGIVHLTDGGRLIYAYCVLNNRR